jgi:hypothetical protein
LDGLKSVDNAIQNVVLVGGAATVDEKSLPAKHI